MRGPPVSGRALALLDDPLERLAGAGHVDGAINLDVESGDFASGIAALPKDTTYNVYCRSGRRSALAADQLAESGFTSVVNLDGGLADLQSAGVPVVTG